MKIIESRIVENIKRKGLIYEVSLSYEECFCGSGYYVEITPVDIGSKRTISKRYTSFSYKECVLMSKKNKKSGLKRAVSVTNRLCMFLSLDEENKYAMAAALAKSEFGKKIEDNDFSSLFDAKKRSSEKDKITFDDVAGLKEVKEELYEIVDAVKNKEKYKKMGAKLPKGILFYGPPGTGKTLLAKALSGETESNFICVSGSEFTEKYVGVGAKRVRELFKEAKKKSPSIIFIDEMDSLCSKRVGDSNKEKDQTLNQLLVEMDGFNDSTDVVVIGATNRLDLLDNAVKRPGRFGKHIYIGKPDLQTRKELFEVHTKNKPLNDDVDIDLLSKKTHGLTGADISEIANNAAILAIRKERDSIKQDDFEESLEKIIAGLKSKTKRLGDKEKEVVSYHEAGHALLGLMLRNNKIQKISIIPHGQALGFVMSLPDEDRYLHSKEDLINEIKVILAGRVAESIMFSSITTGASDDLKKATNIAISMVCSYGMSSVNGLISRDISSIEDLSKLERNAVDEILNNAYSDVESIINDNKDNLSKIANYLYENEEMTLDELKEIFVGDSKMEAFFEN